MLPRLATLLLFLATAAFALLSLLHPGVGFVIRPVVTPLALAFGVTPLAQPFFALIALVVPAIGLWSYSRGTTRTTILLAAFTATMLLVLLAQSVAAFVLSWEMMTLVSAFLVATHHERRAVRSALFSYLVVSQFGALCITVSLALLAIHAQSVLFSVVASHAATLPPILHLCAGVLALAGFGSKAGLLPLHVWLPRAHPAAPADASALLSGVMLNVAIYGLLLLALTLAAPMPLGIAVAAVALGAFSAAVGALYAAIETEMKRLLAFSSIENSGIVVAIVGTAMLAQHYGDGSLAGLALLAALFHAINHGLFKSILFLGAGTVAQQARTTQLDHLGGLTRALPRSAPLVFIGCMAASSLPGTNGFASEWLIFRGLIAAFAGPVLVQFTAACTIALLAISSASAAFAFVKLYGIGFLGTARTTHPIEPERDDGGSLGLGALAALCIALGLAPALALGPLNQLVHRLVAAPPSDLGTITVLPLAIFALPLLLAVASLALTRVGKTRYASTWTCGSPVTSRSQYTATAFSKPLRLIFSGLFAPQRDRDVVLVSPWVPTYVKYEVSARYFGDGATRRFAAVVTMFARRVRIIQGGRLQIYLGYAFAAFTLVLVFVR